MRIRESLTAEFFEKGFTQETDPFGLLDLANRLTSLFGALEHGTVAILDGRWGTGKSTFVKQWQKHLTQRNFPAIYFDAFGSDYMSDPFIAISALFIKAAKDAKKQKTSAYKRLLNSTAAVARQLGGTAAKVGVKGVTLGIVGTEDLEGLSKIAEDLGTELGDSADKYIRKQLEEQAGQEATFTKLRKSLAGLPDLLSESGSKHPSLVVIIDELDRCRPDFALGILESLKHFFRADRVHFVLVTNRKHLLSSVSARYGISSEDAEEYIQKFYDFIIHFEQPLASPLSSKSSIIISRTVKNLVSNVLPEQEVQSIISSLESVTSVFQSTIRQAEFITSNVLMAYLSVRSGVFKPYFLVAYLSALKVYKPDLYQKAKIRQLSFSDISKWLLDGHWSDISRRDNVVKVMRFYLDPSLDEKSEEYRHASREIYNFQFDSRLDVVPYLANAVIDRFAPGQVESVESRS